MCFLAYIPQRKECHTCHIIQEWECFSSEKVRPEGMSHMCKSCDAKKQAGARKRNHAADLVRHQQYREQNGEKIRQRQREKYQQNPAPERQRSLIYHYAHRKEANTKSLQYSHTHRERLRLTNQIYRSLHKHKAERLARDRQRADEIRIQVANRRARIRELPNTFTADDYLFMMNYWHNACAVCGNQPGLYWTLAFDHWIPLASDECPGTVARNMIPLCHGLGGCNNSKIHNPALPWLQKRYGKREASRIMRTVQEYFSQVMTRTFP
jgi:hypothetical protein